MGSDDFITLESSSHSDHEVEENGLHESNSVQREGECGATTSPRGVSDGNDLDAFKENVEMEEGEHVQDMDLESDAEQEQPISNENTKLVVETPKEVEKASDDVCTFTVTDTTTNNLQIDNSPIAGVKRARMTYEDRQPCVRVVYNFLTRESKKKLMELMQEWSEWHAQSNSSSTVNTTEALENGEETYFPALHVGSEKNATVSFWVDNQARNEDIKSIQLDYDSVPLYDRGYTLGSTSLGGSADSERIETLEASRCFNCGSYSHALKECPKPRDNATISNARKNHSAKRNSTPGSRVQVRYYQKTQGKFDDLKPGVLGPETRESLGIGEFDPPPWLHRMRELGYPPGYLDVVEDEDQPSGIAIFADEETKMEFEDGEIPEKGDLVSPERKMTVEFPGINAPIPENADHRRWAAASTFRNHSHHRPTRILDTQRGLYSDRQRNDSLPGTEYGIASGYRSSDHHRGHFHERHRDDGPPGTGYGPSSGSGHAVHSYSPTYGHYDHNNSPHTGRNPNFGRSLSDRGWQSPVGYDGMQPVHSPRSPYPYPSGSRQAPADPYHSPSASLDRWALSGSPSIPTSDVPSQAQQERQEHHQRRHRGK